MAWKLIKFNIGTELVWVILIHLGILKSITFDTTERIIKDEKAKREKNEEKKDYL